MRSRSKRVWAEVRVAAERTCLNWWIVNRVLIDRMKLKFWMLLLWKCYFHSKLVIHIAKMNQTWRTNYDKWLNAGHQVGCRNGERSNHLGKCQHVRWPRGCNEIREAPCARAWPEKRLPRPKRKNRKIIFPMWFVSENVEALKSLIDYKQYIQDARQSRPMQCTSSNTLQKIPCLCISLVSLINLRTIHLLTQRTSS